MMFLVRYQIMNFSCGLNYGGITQKLQGKFSLPLADISTAQILGRPDL